MPVTTRPEAVTLLVQASRVSPGDPDGRREQTAQRLALRGAGPCALVAPGNERVEAGDERRACGRGEDRAGTHRVRRDAREVERRPALSRHEERGHDEELQADREVRAEPHRRLWRRDDEGGEGGERGEHSEDDDRCDEVDRDRERDEDEADAEHERLQDAVRCRGARAREEARGRVRDAERDADRADSVQSIRRLDGRPSRGRPFPERAAGGERRVEERIEQEWGHRADRCGRRRCGNAPGVCRAPRCDEQSDERERGRGDEQREFRPEQHDALR